MSFQAEWTWRESERVLIGSYSKNEPCHILPLGRDGMLFVPVLNSHSPEREHHVSSA